MLCQGTLIDVKWVLTSENCIKYNYYSYISRHILTLIFVFSNNNHIPMDDIDLVIGGNTPEIIRKPKKVVVENDVTLIEVNKCKMTIFNINTFLYSM